MRRIETDELKQLELDILDYVARFCEEHEITYWLDFGTLIGAVRHKGYIPWDDDIDISMMSADYDKFIRLFTSEQTGKYELCCPENDSECGLLFGQVMNKKTLLYEHQKISRDPDPARFINKKHHAVKIDIFIYDNAPDDDDELRKIFRKRDFYRRITDWRTKKRRPQGNLFRRTCAYAIRFLNKIIFSPLPVNYFLKKATKIFRKYESVRTKRVACFTSWQSVAVDRHIFDSFIDVDFEGRKYKAPSGYDELLRAHYGDYMQLPPVEERVAKHEFIAYMLED